MDDLQPPGVLTTSGDIEFGIEEILDSRIRKIGRGSRKEVLVKWTGYAKPSCHPEVDFQETAALDAYEIKIMTRRTGGVML